MTLISRILGFARDMIIARYFGADSATDAFFVAFRIPNFLRRLFAEGSFSQALVPVLSQHRETSDDREVKLFLDRSLGSLGLILFAVSSAGIIAAPLLILVFAPGFIGQDGQFDLSARMLRITFPYLFFITLTACAGGILNTYRRFAIPAITPALLNLSMIAAAIWLAPHLSEPVTALAWGVLIAGCAQLLFQVPALWSAGLLPRPRLGFHDPEVRRVLRRMVPAIFGVSVTQVNLLVDTLIASFLISGSVSWLYYSDRLVEFPLGIFGVAIATVILPHLAKTHANRDEHGFSRSLDWALRWVLLIGVPATLGLMVLAKPLMATLFQYDEFSARDVEMAGRSLMTYSLGLLGFIATKVLAPGFSARHDYHTPVRFGLCAMLTNLLLSLALVTQLAPWGWGHAGLALSTALAALLNSALLLWKLLRERIYRPQAGWWVFLLRVGLAGMAMAGLLSYACGGLPWQDWTLTERVFHLLYWITAGGAAYFACLGLAGLRPRHLALPEEIYGMGTPHSAPEGT